MKPVATAEGEQPVGDVGPGDRKLRWLARAGLPAVLIFGGVAGLTQLAAHRAGVSGWGGFAAWVAGLALGYLASRAFLRAMWVRTWDEAG